MWLDILGLGLSFISTFALGWWCADKVQYDKGYADGYMVREKSEALSARWENHMNKGEKSPAEMTDEELYDSNYSGVVNTEVEETPVIFAGITDACGGSEPFQMPSGLHHLCAGCQCSCHTRIRETWES